MVADGSGDPALAILVLCKATAAAVLAMVGRLHIAAEIPAIDFNRLAVAAKPESVRALAGRRK